jgi:hypothetical protein
MARPGKQNRNQSPRKVSLESGLPYIEAAGWSSPQIEDRAAYGYF